MRGIAAGCLALFTAVASGGSTLQVDLDGTQRVVADFRTPVDDEHLANPVGYFPPERPVTRIVHRITVENTGPGPIENPDIRINGVPLFPVADPLVALGVSDVRDLLSLFAKWRDRAVHATTNLEANHDPLAVLHAIGAGFCGDDTRAFAAITASHGAEVRFARLNGHSVAEHRLGGDWMLLDGDQNLFYLGWDNLTPVSEDDIQADPFLALRTQVFGRQSGWELVASWQNTSRFEFIDHTHAQKIFRLKNVPPKRNWTLQPGEKITIRLDEIPKKVAASSEALRSDSALREVTCLVEFQPRNRPRNKLLTPYPLLAEQPGEPLYEFEASEAASALCQAVRSQFPALRSGKNTFESKTGGKLQVTFDYTDAANLKPAAAPSLQADSRRILIDAQGADRVWWQVAADRHFHLVPPNFDRVVTFKPEIAFSPIDQTFLSSGGSYFLRAKVRRNGVWSDWCEPVSFTAEKPAQPAIVNAEGADGDQTCIRWKSQPGEMLVFGSDRLDFLPEVFGETEITRLENGSIGESRPNRNLLAAVPGQKGEAYVPVRACYRLIARDGEALSVPSALLRVQNAPKAKVLQTRHEKADDALTGRDVAVEMEIP
ncbi:MAG TPA: hypothetical protein VNB29_04280 [Chthoniobacterales bacterium]|nr:hypothetical protein [Chthoniobacterales bacterium]